MKFSKSLIALAFTAVSLHTFATVDSFVSVLYPRINLVDEGLCLQRTIALDGASSMASTGVMAKVQAIVSEQHITQVLGGTPTININRVADPDFGQVKITDISDDARDLMKVHVELDVADVVAKSKNIQEASDKIKIVYVSVAKSVLDLQGVKLHINLVNLPSQIDVAGTRLQAKTTSPITRGSSYLAKLEKDLVEKDLLSGECK